MTSGPRRARVNALAKINLGLKVLNKRPDGFHELRTVYQTISLADVLDIEFTPARRTSVAMVSSPEIPDNLVLRAARLVMDAMRVAGKAGFRLHKRIPMGAGLGGGSSDAAAVLLTLPVLAGRRMPLDELIRLAGELGSDVPLFLLGGTVLGVGRGSEVYPLPDLPRRQGLLVVPPIHVSTAEAYRALGRELTNDAVPNMISSFQSCIWRNLAGVSEGVFPGLAGNDFEEIVFRQHPKLKSIKAKLQRLGAAPAMLTGSGSALFGMFRERERLEEALPHFHNMGVHPFVFVSRRGYRALWRRRLGAHRVEEIWPPQSRRDDS
ncbi:MAG: 4-(cytidine 5'-diphospho)-2-C-methyl-D-erythritol kinase [Bryobacteraceae bacterium]